MLNVIDEADRGGLEIDVVVSIPALRMIRFLEASRGGMSALELST